MNDFLSNLTDEAYTLIIKQQGIGCDYTIGCGMTTLELTPKRAYVVAREYFEKEEVDSIEDLETLFICAVRSWYGEDIESIKYTKTENLISLDNKIITIISQLETKAEQRKIERRERLELKRLQEKYSS